MEYVTSERDRPTRLIAEIGNVHDGSIGNCHAFIDAVAGKCNAVKFQAHIAAAESTPDERFPQRFSFHPQDKSRTDYWKRMEIPVHHMFELRKRAVSNGLKFILSPFSETAVKRYDHLVDIWKVPSGEVTNSALLIEIKRTGKPVILSSGMSRVDDINSALMLLAPVSRDRLTVLQCTTQYPTPPERVGLNIAWEWSRNMVFDGGLSDHSGTIWPGVIAAYLGAAWVEVHVCWHRQQFGVDVSSSLTIDELGQLYAGIQAASTYRMHPVNKDEIREKLPDTAAYTDGKRRTEVNVYEIGDSDSGSGQLRPAQATD